MMKKLGYQFHVGDFSMGLHFDVYPPGYDPETNPALEFWITVKKGKDHYALAKNRG
jgi:hypothetical protein